MNTPEAQLLHDRLDSIERNIPTKKRPPMPLPQVTVEPDRARKPTPDAPRWEVVTETLRSWGSGPAAHARTVHAYGYSTGGGWVTFRDEDGGVVLDLPERVVLSIERMDDAEETAAA